MDMDSAAGIEPDERPVGLTDRGGRGLLIAGAVAAAAAPWVWVLGLVGMVLGSLAHLKHERWGLHVAGGAAVTMIIGMSLLFFTTT